MAIWLTQHFCIVSRACRQCLNISFLLTFSCVTFLSYFSVHKGLFLYNFPFATFGFFIIHSFNNNCTIWNSKIIDISLYLLVMRIKLWHKAHIHKLCTSTMFRKLYTKALYMYKKYRTTKIIGLLPFYMVLLQILCGNLCPLYLK